MGQRTMDKPPTKAKPSAEAEEAPDELRARLLELAGIDSSDKLGARLFELAADYLAAFHREPTEENLQLWHLLFAISSMPDRRRELARHERRLASQAAPQTNPQHPNQFWREAWVRLISPLVADCGGNPDTVARELIAALPAWLRAKCPNYPTTAEELDQAVTRVLADENFEPELIKCCNQGPWNPLLVARAVVRGVGMKPKDAKSLFRKSQWEAVVREHGAT
jgi:hypothetical protein